MWIWQTIKSILNYLYNHLIDLVWVKKIKFEDGTEMTTAGGSGGAGANLYDIKLLTQAIADKGWACLCKSTRQDLSKVNVPTIYNDILDKLNNADETISSFVQKESLSAGSSVCYSNGKWFVIKNQSSGYTTNIDTPIISLNEPYSIPFNVFIVGNNIVIYTVHDTLGELF